MKDKTESHCVSVILPTYNEEKNIVPLCKAIRSALGETLKEILVVDDQSKDDTYLNIKNANLNYVRFLTNSDQRSLAKSISYGLRNQTSKYVVVMDSDFNHQPQYLPFMIDSLRYFDVVSGSRFIYGGSMDSKVRYKLSKLFNLFVKFTLGATITDHLYGFWATESKNLSQIDFDRVFWGYGDYYIRLMYFFQNKNISILEFPAINGRRLHGQGASRFFSIFSQYFREVVKLVIKEGRITKGTPTFPLLDRPHLQEEKTI